jgi:hypothetical protein
MPLRERGHRIDTGRTSAACFGSFMSSAGRTCSTPASTWPNIRIAARERRAARGIRRCTARFSGGTAVSSTNGCGRASPCTLPSSPTARLRIAYTRLTASAPLASVAEPRDARIGAQMLDERMHARIDVMGVVAAEFDQVDAERRTPVVLRKYSATLLQTKSFIASISTFESTVSIDSGR